MHPSTIEIRNSITAESSAHWGADRIIIDMLQNHLPADSGGTSFSLEYLIDGQWLPHEQANGHIMRAGMVRVTDDGRGYDYRKLGLEFSDKPRNETEQFDGKAAGKFGEGLNEAIALTLEKAGVETDRNAASGAIAEVQEVPIESLTHEEREMLDNYRLIEKILKLPHVENVKVFSRAFNRWGEEVMFPGFYNGNIYIRREYLKDLPEFSRLYLHEKGHKLTNASDPEDAFRAFFECFLTGFVLMEIEKARGGEPQSTVNVDFSPALEAENHKLRAEVGSLRAQLGNLKAETEILRRNQKEDELGDDEGVLPVPGDAGERDIPQSEPPRLAVATAVGECRVHGKRT